ncbi:ComF family protein [Alteribacillus sp. HJP-4]|uniref:ComF family protein n=1 Tax=Alteribacillus sp. HJP-4 TaxID=2775394 RepID=UPI0035CCF3B9
MTLILRPTLSPSAEPACLYCGAETNEPLTWETFLALTTKQALLCSSCQSRFVHISGERCRGCSRPLAELSKGLVKEFRCRDCDSWENRHETQGLLERNFSIYSYNDMMKDFIARWKYRGDAAMILAFREKLRTAFLHQFAGYMPVPLPLHPERLLERSFNQSALIAALISQPLTITEHIKRLPRPLPVQEILERTAHEQKQSKKSRAERISFNELPFRIRKKKESLLKSKDIVLIDDIYTTGTTVRKAAAVLKQAGAGRIASFTLVRG